MVEKYLKFRQIPYEEGSEEIGNEDNYYRFYNALFSAYGLNHNFEMPFSEASPIVNNFFDGLKVSIEDVALILKVKGLVNIFEKTA